MNTRHLFVKTLSVSLVCICLFAPKVYGQVTNTERLELTEEKRVTGSWDLQLQTEASKSLAEYTDWDGALSAKGEIKYKNFDFGAGAVYNYPFDSEVTVTEERRYGLEDVELSATYIDLLSSPIRSLKPTSYILLPTSEVSQKATMVATGSVGVLYSQEEMYFKWNTSHRLIAAAHQYDTADALGSSYNSPFGISNSAGISRTFDKITLSTSYTLYTYYNYATNIKNLQTLRSSIKWEVEKEWSLTAYYRWRDQVVSNLSAFNDDTSKAGLFLTYSM